jgi:hypothetical protein
MEFTPDDFKRMMFNVYEADMNKSFLTQFPELNLYDEFSERLSNLDRNKIIKYICCVYDKNSPYKVKYKDITTRKVQAIMDAGYPLENGVFDKEVEDVLQGRNPKVADMVIAFVKLHCDLGYSHVVLLESMYYKTMKDVMLGQSAKILELQKTKEAYEAAMNDILEHDKDKGLARSLYKSINSDKLRLSPEDIAKDILEKGKADQISDDGDY